MLPGEKCIQVLPKQTHGGRGWRLWGARNEEQLIAPESCRNRRLQWSLCVGSRRDWKQEGLGYKPQPGPWMGGGLCMFTAPRGEQPSGRKFGEWRV